MWAEKLKERILLPPTRQCNRLVVLAGYGSASFAEDHILSLGGKGSDFQIELTLGMVPWEGIGNASHERYQRLESVYAGTFQCYYRTNSPRSHAKCYVWLNSQAPVRAYIGSANYSRTAFDGGVQKEIMTQVDETTAWDFVQRETQLRISCSDPSVSKYVSIVPERRWTRIRTINAPLQVPNPPPDLVGVPSVRLPLYIKRTGKTHQGGGLNWSHTPKRMLRDQNEAYIPVSSHVYRTGFFPPKDRLFLVVTDDNQHFECKMTQGTTAEPKAIETPDSLAILGRYFRSRMNVPLGSFVSHADLVAYGRDHVDFYRIGDDVYFMDFSL